MDPGFSLLKVYRDAKGRGWKNPSQNKGWETERQLNLLLIHLRPSSRNVMSSPFFRKLSGVFIALMEQARSGRERASSIAGFDEQVCYLANLALALFLSPQFPLSSFFCSFLFHFVPLSFSSASPKCIGSQQNEITRSWSHTLAISTFLRPLQVFWNTYIHSSTHRKWKHLKPPGSCSFNGTLHTFWGEP